MHAHAYCLGLYMHREMTSLRHSNGQPLISMLGKSLGDEAADSSVNCAAKHETCGRSARLHHYSSLAEPYFKCQSPVANFEILQPDGQVFSYKAVGSALNKEGVQVRTGCCCNPGACYHALVSV